MIKTTGITNQERWFDVVSFLLGMKTNGIPGGPSWVEENTDQTPYLLRPSGGGPKEMDKIVGGTIAWNQLVENGDFADGSGWNNIWTINNNIASYTAETDGTFDVNLTRNYTTVVGHVYLMLVMVNFSESTRMRARNPWVASGKTIDANTWTQYADMNKTESTNANSQISIQISGKSGVTFQVKNFMLFDFTQMFGSSIADYIYGLETSHAGDGVAFFRNLFPKTFYAFDAGTLMSVNASAHIMRDSGDNIIGNYPLDNTLTLRGLANLDALNHLYYDGDEYESDGTVTRRYGIVDLGTLSWSYDTSGANPVFFSYTGITDKKQTFGNLGVCSKYDLIANQSGVGNAASNLGDKQAALSYNTTIPRVFVRDSAYTDADTFKTAMSGVYLVYELSESVTETADPFTNPQNVDKTGTEEYVDYAYSSGDRDVAIPVGHDTSYGDTLTEMIKRFGGLAADPGEDAVYTLTATVDDGEVTYTWEEVT